MNNQNEMNNGQDSSMSMSNNSKVSSENYNSENTNEKKGKVVIRGNIDIDSPIKFYDGKKLIGKIKSKSTYEYFIDRDTTLVFKFRLFKPAKVEVKANENVEICLGIKYSLTNEKVLATVSEIDNEQVNNEFQTNPNNDIQQSNKNQQNLNKKQQSINNINQTHVNGEKSKAYNSFIKIEPCFGEALKNTLLTYFGLSFLTLFISGNAGFFIIGIPISIFIFICLCCQYYNVYYYCQHCHKLVSIINTHYSNIKGSHIYKCSHCFKNNKLYFDQNISIVEKDDQ